MKCPKCGYISFDYNTKCPKCNKDIGMEQDKLNFPPFKPTPPFLLESLVGEATDSSPALKVVRHNKAAEVAGDSDLGESNVLDKSDSSEIQEINIASFNTNEPQEQSFGDLELPSDSSSSALNLDQSGDEISLDLDQSRSDMLGNKEDLSLDLDHISTKKSENEIDLKLDDFSLNETEGAKPSARKGKAPQKASLDDISTDVDLDDEDLSIDLENLDLDLDLDSPEK